MDPPPQADGTTLKQLEREIDERFGESYSEPIRSKAPIDLGIYVVGFAFFVYHVWFALTRQISGDHHAILHLAFILFLWSLFGILRTDRSKLRGKLKTIGFFLYAGLSIVPLYYMYTNYLALTRRAGIYNDTDLLMGTLLIGLILIAILSVSRLIALIAVFGLIYAYFGSYMPGILNHRGLPIERIITMNTVEMDGILGSLLHISATWVVIFLLLAGLIEKYGGMATFIKGITKVASRSSLLEIGQIALLSSMFMGSINGSTAANTATTGAFTIPLMSENGYRPKVAAAIEAVASSGGQILPPVMGAAAFLMAEIIQPSYSDIIIAGSLPALLFFITVAVSISLNSYASDWTINSVADERSPVRRVTDVVRHYEMIGMFVVLLYYLVIVRADPMVAGAYAIATLMVLRLVRLGHQSFTDDERTVQATATTFTRETIEGFRRGAEVTINITILLASLGIIVRAFIVTGFAQQMASEIVAISGGEMIVLLLLAMITSIAFGVGMSTTPAYMIVAIMVAPALVESGVDTLIAHFFVFYFAVVSNITPPIAVSVIIAQGIAGSRFWETALEAIRIGFPMFLLPFAFFFNPSLIYLDILSPIVFLVVLTAFVVISIALVGRFRTPVSPLVRGGLAIGGALTLVAPSFAAQIVLTLGLLGVVAYIAREGVALTPNSIR